MPDRLSALDASFLYMDQPTTPMHVGSVSIFRKPRSGFDYDGLLELISSRIGLVPRYRQKIREVPGRMARPVWIDDVDFDVTYHVRRSALPPPGTERALCDLVARLMSRPLDHTRPLWEMYLVDGLSGGRVALVTKTHQAMVDGVASIDIGQVVLDDTAAGREWSTAPGRPTADEEWVARREPSSWRLIYDAVSENVSRPGNAVEAARDAVRDAADTVTKVAGVAGGLFSAVRTAVRPAPVSPLNVPISTQRRFAMTRTDLEDYRAVRRAHGGTINDVVLAVIAGALRNWLLSRGATVSPTTTMRAMVPLSVRGDAETTGSIAGAGLLGNQIASFLVDLPVGEPNAVLRMHHVAHAMREHRESGQSVGANALVRVGGFAPPTLHALGARAANGVARRLFNLVVSNVPGPQHPLYAAGAKMLEMYPVVPLAKGQSLAVGLTSYDGGVFYGFNADRDSMADVDELGELVTESLAELRATAPR
ncbi:WS/DGAT/MGAT family O-acyltransferase [Actinomycetospora lemnae]|uniref:Diacylglycerol O-acyltransferase n=1 Tax=Actinomycetospora lemnae TaxID=3019891 RepID=A0ABT5SLQ2_9PSEU|nr:wax ester/triacylglycerol synthase family O-acyltransferase [Actinomycetospora sp. DW7H6]MDD7963762.1 wax ester/triacylglycerol synthase family O-acyltransferase [Actinomycetospora sp. DW7H6]